MAKKKTKGKATKNVGRKTGAKGAGAKRSAGTAAKKPRKPAPKSSPTKPALPKTVEPRRGMDLLRAWSPSRYSTR